MKSVCEPMIGILTNNQVELRLPDNVLSLDPTV